MRAALAAVVLLGCTGTAETGDDTSVAVEGCTDVPCETLSQYGFFSGTPSELVTADGVLPYEVASVLWSDGAIKDRFFVLPAGTSIGFDIGEDWDFPVGSIVGKSFSYAPDLRSPDVGRYPVETRLLVHEDEGWTGHVYLWRDDLSDADKLVAGTRVDVAYIDGDGNDYAGEYIVPNTNQCQGCHGRDDANHLLGVFTHQLNREVEHGGASLNQLGWLDAQGAFDVSPPGDAPAFPDPFGTADLHDRARAYLHANCSHCHRPTAAADASGLVLLEWEDDPATWGVCKTPAAAGAGTGGLTYDISPGLPDESILIFRVNSTDPAIKMPEFPNLIVHRPGVELLTEWIAAMDQPPCD
jgi:uncharacterized repeat protein (TIGR03806 family)